MSVTPESLKTLNLNNLQLNEINAQLEYMRIRAIKSMQHLRKHV